MTVGELKKILEEHDDNTLVLVESECMTTDIDEVETVRYKKVKKQKGWAGGYQRYQTAEDSWDTPQKFKGAERAVMITCNAYYLAAEQARKKRLWGMI